MVSQYFCYKIKHVQDLLESMWDCLGLAGTLWGCLELSGIVWNSPGLSGTLQDFLVLFLRLSGVVWESSVVLFGTI